MSCVCTSFIADQIKKSEEENFLEELVDTMTSSTKIEEKNCNNCGARNFKIISPEQKQCNYCQSTYQR